MTQMARVLTDLSQKRLVRSRDNRRLPGNDEEAPRWERRDELHAHPLDNESSSRVANGPFRRFLVLVPEMTSLDSCQTFSSYIIQDKRLSRDVR